MRQAELETRAASGGMGAAERESFPGLVLKPRNNKTGQSTVNPGQEKKGLPCLRQSCAGHKLFDNQHAGAA